MLEAIKLVGALSGILSLAWNIWERTLRDWPDVDVGPDDSGPIVTITNPTKYTIIIEEFRIEPPLYAINEVKAGNELELAVNHALQVHRKQLPASDRDLVLAPGAAKLFHLKAHKDNDVDVAIKISTIWRFSHNRAVLFHPPIVRTLPAGTLKVLKLETTSE